MPDKILPPETIYALIPKKEVKVEKPPRYVSIFKDKVKQESLMNKAARKTMGPAKVDPPLPQKYLLKHSKEPTLPPKKPFSYGNGLYKPPVPDKSEFPTLVERTRRDFVKTNMANAESALRKHQPACADTVHGHTCPLENSGLILQFVKKKDFAKTPQYLYHMQDEKKRAQELYDEYMQECIEKEALKQLSEEERQKIIQGLKTNLDDLQHQYQGLSVMTDTVRKKHRKENLEQKMKQLEIFIKLIEQHKISITNN